MPTQNKKQRPTHPSHPQPTPKKFESKFLTPKRKRSPGIVTPLKIPRLNFPANKSKIPQKTKRKNPNPHKDQQLFVKIDSKLTLIKHNDLATSRKLNTKKSAKIPLPQTNLQIPINPLDQPNQPKKK
jgi:hypothetical protein